MSDNKYTLLRHLSSALIAGLLFSLVIGLIFSFKMIGINEAMHNYSYAYPFLLNFVPLYMIFGLIFGVAFGIIGGLIIRHSKNFKGLGIMASYGVSVLAFLLGFFIFRQPLGPIVGMFLATLTFIAVHGLRPALSRIYFVVFFTSIFFNYSWQWVRQHFIINPLMPMPNSRTLDLIFTIFWALIFLAGFRIFLKAFFRLPVKTFYIVGFVIILLLIGVGGIYYAVRPHPAEASIATDLKIERRPTDVKVLIIGIDGMWWKVMEPLMEQGRMPNVNTLVQKGTSGPLATLFPTFTSTIWSSISTGKSAQKHGVTSFLIWKFPWTGFTVPCFITPKITAEIKWMKTSIITEVPITNEFLDSTPIWLMLSDHGASVGTVNWWVSWPAHEVNGFVVTDHCLYNKTYEMLNFMQKEGNTPYDIYPQELLSELVQFAHGPNDITEEELRRFVNISDPSFLDEFRAIDTYDYLDIAYEASMFKYSYPEDATYANAAKYLIQTRQPDFMAVYLKGTDSMEHQYLKYYFSELHEEKLIPQNLNRYRDLIDNYYSYIDEVIGSFVEVADSNTIFMIVSDHGFDEIMLPTGHYNHMDSPPGVFICSGPGIKSNHRIESAHVYDITPTILHIMGFPTAEDFDGKVLTDIMSDNVDVQMVKTYETSRRASRKILKSDIDQSYKERLKALGYTN